MSLTNLKNGLSKNNFQKLYLFYGEELYLKEYYLNQLIDRVIINKELKAFNQITLLNSGEQEIIEACETPPMFEEKKIVIAKYSSIFKSTKNEAKKKKNR